jgi:hypothetical protein
LLDVQLDKAVHLRRSHRRPTGIADALQLGAHGGAVVHGPDCQRLLQRHAAHHHQTAHHVGLKACAFLVGENATCRGLRVRSPASRKVATTSSPAITP